jgi:hypothetical protein
VDWALNGNGANPALASDFAGNVLPSGTVSFAAGETSKTILIPINNDSIAEADESFTITLTNPSGASLDTVAASAQGTIIDDDGSPSILDITATDATKSEGNSGTTIYTFTVSRSGDTSGSSTAAWAVSSTQATGDDFIGGVLPTGTVTFAAGDTSKTITVEVNGDWDYENDETFSVSLSGASSGYINNGSAAATILNDDPVPCLAAGTMIRTPSGDRPVEELEIGDLVLTPDGPQPLKFLGISTRHVNNLQATGRMPVLITAGVFGENLPLADIYCTPSHAFALGDCLVEAQALINGQSIYQLEQLSEFDQFSPQAESKEVDSFTYYSLEFDQHALVWANDLLTESYLPTYRDGELTRMAWNNYDHYLSLYGSSETMNELAMPRIPFSRQLPLRIRERFKLGSSSATSGLDASREELCLTL